MIRDLQKNKIEQCYIGHRTSNTDMALESYLNNYPERNKL